MNNRVNELNAVIEKQKKTVHSLEEKIDRLNEKLSNKQEYILELEDECAAIGTELNYYENH